MPTPIDDQRGSRPRRAKVFQPATLSLDGAASRVHLLDISLTGALAHAAAPPPAEAAVQIECAGIRRSARVRWCEGKRFGLHFDLPLLPEQLHRLAPPLPGPAGQSSPSALA